jgi:hypothetical protein
MIGIHSHIPYETGDEEFEYLYNHKLKPLLVALNNYPKIAAVLHFSGVLLHRIEKVHPGLCMLISDMISRKQVELLGGGFYEPMLPLIPHLDKIGQIEMLTTYIRKQYGKRPQGCWIPAFAWEQNIPRVLSDCGMGYTFLMDTQFIEAGLEGEALFAPCITEDQGKLIMVFPISHRLLREFRRDAPGRVLERLVHGLPAGAERIITLFPQYFLFENAGAPDARSVEGRINQFFDELSRYAFLADFTVPAKFYKTLRGVKRNYFPNSAGGEYVWAEGVEEQELSRVRPRQFLITHPEANGIYAKMMFTHVLINQFRGDISRKRTARKELWKAQGYDGFCRSESGGIYRNTIRNTMYRALLEAERITREKGVFIPSIMAFDFDLDGEEEYLFQEETINCYIKTEGASVFEFDFLPKTWNYLNTLSAGQGAGPSAGAHIAGRRGSFADFLAPEDFSFRGGAEKSILRFPLPPGQGSGADWGVRFCAAERYKLLDMDKSRETAGFKLFPRPDLPFGSVEIEKTYALDKDALYVRYRLVNQGERELRCALISRIDLSFPGEGDLYQRFYALGGGAKKAPLLMEGDARDIRGIECQDLKNEVILTLAGAAAFHARITAVRTPCRIFGKERDLYQSTCIIPVIPVVLEPKAGRDFQYELRLSY